MLDGSLELSTAPTFEPVTVAGQKIHSRIDSGNEDGLIADYIKSARRWCEAFTNRQFVTATYKYYLPEWLPVIELPKPPVSSVTSITYVDTGGTTQTLSASIYQVDTKSIKPRIMPAYGQTWPDIRHEVFNPITITYVAGYGSTVESVPDDLRMAIMQLVSHWYEHREAVSDFTLSGSVEMTLSALLWPYRVVP